MAQEQASKDDGPSKNEQKKLAKKAAKAALKAAKKEGKGGDTGAGAASKTPAAAELSAPPPPLSLLLHNLDTSDASLKAVWACKVFYDVTKVKTGRASKENEPMAPLPSLVSDNDGVVVMGGNAMAKAFATLGNAASSFKVDEWCEWEHEVLRDKPTQTCLDHLSTILASKHYLVGHGLTVADICVLVTLYSLEENNKDLVFSPTIQEYCNVHRGAYEAAKTDAAELLQANKVDLNNPSLNKVVNHVFGNAISQAFGSAVNLEDLMKKNIVDKTQNPKHGDFQCNAAMPIFAALKRNNALPTDIKSPQHVAQQLISVLEQESNGIVEELRVQGPGFVTCRVSAQFLQDHMNRLVQVGALPKPPHVEPTVCLVDFSSPNIAKEMHVGHLRSTIIGESVCRILEFAGHEVHRINHVGDWGTQFGMLIQYLKEEYPNFHESKPNITDLTLFYKSAKERFDASPEFKKMSQTNVVKLQSGDAECKELWQLLCNVSRTEFQKVYNRLDITVKECGESFYNDKIPAVIEEFEKAGLISVEEGGAKCVFVDGYKIPLMLQKSDGGYGYDSTDMAALSHRLFTVKAKRIIVITDFSQGDHFKMCFLAADKIGWLTHNEKLQHIGFGTVQGQDGKRFKTRSGDTVRLVDLLDEAVSRMETSLKERIQENKANITLDQVHGVAEAIGYGAVKYFDLRRNPTTNYKFSYDQMLDTKGNTAVYLLYAHARLQSILAKAQAQHGVKVEDLLESSEEKIVIGHASERNLALNLQMFADTMTLTLEDLYPYHICEYLYNTAIAASDFVTQCKVLGTPEMSSRLLLCHATTLAMQECFQLLGIRPVMRI